MHSSIPGLGKECVPDLLTETTKVAQFQKMRCHKLQQVLKSVIGRHGSCRLSHLSEFVYSIFTYRLLELFEEISDLTRTRPAGVRL